MKKFIAVALAGTLVAGTMVASTVTADARDVDNNTAGAAIAGGIFGFALGALATQQQPYGTYGYYPSYGSYGYDPYATTTYGYYAQPAYPVYGGDHVSWCEHHYRSYNPATDTFVGYDGYAHRCVSPY